jgi:hypothetical protein
VLPYSAELAASAGFLLGLLYDTEYVGDMLLLNVGLSQSSWQSWQMFGFGHSFSKLL